MVLTDLSQRLGSSLKKQTVLGDRELADPVTRFFIDTFPDGPCSERPAFLTSQKASGIRAEVLSAAVRIRKWLDEEAGSIGPADILLLVPDIELYYEEVREIFSAFSIPLRIAEQPAQGTLEMRALSMLRQLWRSRGETEWILALFREFPSLLARRGINLDEFECKLRALPVTGGAGWKRLESLVVTSDDQSLPSFSQAEIDLISEIVSTWVERPKSGYSIKQASDLIISCSEEWLEDPRLLAPVLQALTTMSELIPDLMIPGEMVGLFFSWPETTSSRSGDDRLPGVLFSTIMRARGCTAEAIVILGLSLGRFPARVEEDPLLSDSSRRRLVGMARDVGHRLSVKSRMVDEMTLLFFLLNTSANRVHWVIPETDESGKAVAPTPWVQRYLHRWRDEPTASTQQWRLIPRGPTEQALYLHSLDPKVGTLLPPRFAAFLNTQLRIPAVAPVTSENDPRWLGKVKAAAFSRKRHPDRLSVTELESLARCPYRFYAQVVAGWKTISPQLFMIEPDALAWGSLVHDVFERLLHENLGTNGQLSDLFLNIGNEPFLEIGTVISQLPTWSGLLPGPLRIALAQRLSRTVAAYLAAVKEGECSNGRPVALETKIRLPYPGKDYLKISGQIDRVDDRQGRFNIIDYKSGQTPWTSLQERELEMEIGYRLQPLLYPWLYQTDKGLPYTPAFSFIFLGGEQPKEDLISEPELSEELLLTLVNLLEQGNYFPISDEITQQWGFKKLTPCRYCDLSSLCRRYDLNVRRRSKSLLKEHAGDRFAQILGHRRREKKHAG
jgi:RecB family exonuclease